jgi:hypothetical protein
MIITTIITHAAIKQSIQIPLGLKSAGFLGGLITGRLEELIPGRRGKLIAGRAGEIIAGWFIMDVAVLDRRLESVYFYK